MVSLVIVAFQRAYLPMIGWLVFAVNTLSTGMCFCLGCSVNVFRRSGEVSSYLDVLRSVVIGWLGCSADIFRRLCVVKLAMGP